MLNGVYSASKSFVLSFGHSLQKDLADKGVRVQTVLPGATATEFWDVAGYAAQKTSAITMSAADLVDAALAGLDQGDLSPSRACRTCRLDALGGGSPGHGRQVRQRQAVGALRACNRERRVNLGPSMPYLQLDVIGPHSAGFEEAPRGADEPDLCGR